MAPETMRAVKIVSAGKAEIQTAPVPTLRDHWILVKVKYVAINPTDWKHIDYLAHEGATVGCDFSGTVVDVGPKVSRDFNPGDRIAGVCHGSKLTQHEDGTFGEYCLVKEGVCTKIPDNLSDEEAATIGVATVTIGQGLYRDLGMPYPGSQQPGSGDWVLVYGGSTAMGTFAIQCANLSGYRVVTTCSPRNFEFVKSIGAQAAFDYNDPSCSKNINAHTNDSIKLAFDCVAEGNSAEICAAALSSSGGKISSLLPVKEKNPRPGVENIAMAAYTAMGEPYTMFGQDVDAVPGDYERASEFFGVVTKLLAEGKLVAHPPKLNHGGAGLEGVLKGLQTMREGKVSGFKLVYRIDGS